jgi:hypothetical protein
MQKNRTYIIGLFVLLINLTASLLTAQTSISGFYNEYRNAKQRDNSYFETISGSPYLNDSFSPALVYINGAIDPINSSMRYNNCFDEMEFVKDSTGEFLLLDKKVQIDSIILNNQLYRYLNVNNNNTIESGYFIYITGTRHKLYLKQTKKYQPEKRPTSGYDEYLPAAFIDNDDVFYASIGGDTPVQVPTRKKKIISLLSEKGVSVPEKIRIRYDIESLTTLFNAINTSEN